MKKPLTVKEFAKNNWIMLCILVFVFITSLAIFLIVFWNELYDVGAWGSLVAGIFTYLGSTFLGVVVFYNTQSQQRQKEIEDQIFVDIIGDTSYDKKSGYSIPYTDEEIDKEVFYLLTRQWHNTPDGCDENNMSYLYYQVTNRNTHVPVYVEPISILVHDGKKTQNARFNLYYSNTNDFDAVDYKQTKKCYIGSKKELLMPDYYKKNKNLKYYLIIKLSSRKGEVLYATLEYYMGKTLSMSQPRFFTKQSFIKVLDKYDLHTISIFEDSITNVVHK